MYSQNKIISTFLLHNIEEKNNIYIYIYIHVNLSKSLLYGETVTTTQFLRWTFRNSNILFFGLRDFNDRTSFWKPFPYNSCCFFFFFVNTHPKQSSLEHQPSFPDGSKTLPVFLKDVSYQQCLLLFVKRIHHKHLFHPSKERVSWIFVVEKNEGGLFESHILC